MMNISGLFQSGEYVIPIPYGTPMTFEYNDKGILMKIFLGVNENKEDITHRVLDIVCNHCSIPTKIPILGGTTWVSGVLYCDTFFDCFGPIPQCMSEAQLNYFEANPDKCNFFASIVKSTAVDYKHFNLVKSWLKTAGFYVLSGFVVPYDMTNSQFVTMLDTISFNFNGGCSSFVVWQNGHYRLVDAELTQNVVKDIALHVDNTGCVHAMLKCNDSNSPYIKFIDLSDAYHMNLDKGSIFIQDKHNNIIYVYSHNKSSTLHPTYTCPICFKVTNLPAEGEVRCGDSDCLSNQYPNVCHTLRSFGLPLISYKSYIEYVKNDSIISLSDVFLLPEYADSHISCTLYHFLDAIIPVSVVRDRHAIEIFCNRCNNSVDACMYYLNRIDKLQEDFAISNLSWNQFISWISKNSNYQLITTLLYSKQFEIISLNKLFDGPPIFRNFHIFLTGKFSRGTHQHITSILSSYSATVYTAYSAGCINLVIVGDLDEDVNGVILQDARSRNISVVKESEFFLQYEIDDDVKANVL